ncbi:MAG: hypothetical protein J6K85_03220 [Clostridia bacterium]|nr:hypothetical protein [Clostridia bacterium]
MKKTSILILVLLLVLVLVGVYVFVPDAAQFIDGLLSRLENIKLIEISNNNLDFSLNANISLPKFDISLDTIGAPNFDISIWIIILAVVAIFASTFSAIVSLATTLAFSGVGIYVSLQIIDVYKGLLSNGVDTWQAANSCFWPMFFVVFAIISNGLLGIEGTVMQIVTFKKENAAALGFLFALIFGAIIAFIVAGIAYFLLGCGWAGAIILILVISIIYAISREISNLSIN